MGRKKRVVGTKCAIALITTFVAGLVWYLGMRNFPSKTTTAIIRRSGTQTLRKSGGRKHFIVGQHEQEIGSTNRVETDNAMENTIREDVEQESLDSADEKEVADTDTSDSDETVPKNNMDKSSDLDENEIKDVSNGVYNMVKSEISDNSESNDHEPDSQGENSDEENSDETEDDNSIVNSNGSDEDVDTSSDSDVQTDENIIGTIPVEDKGSFVVKVAPPKHLNNVFFSRPGNGQVSKILLAMGWQQTDNPEKAAILWYQKKQYIPWDKLSKWQRPNHLKLERELGHKGRLLDYMLNYQNEMQVNIPFLPQSFRTWVKSDRERFLKTSETLDNITWIVKIPHRDGGKGISMAPPNSKKLNSLKNQLKPENYDASEAKKDELLIQRYVKNIMLYNGHKFDLRIYWAILSVDPLIVVYHDGTLRVSLGTYDTKNFTDLRVHLTNAVMQKKSTFYRKNKEKTRVSFPEFETYLNDNKDKFDSDAASPFRHIKCQVKKALKTIVLIYAKTLSRSNLPKITTTENAFSLMGADFMVDKKLGIWITELQSGPGLPKNTEAVATVMQSMLPELVNIELEIREKQQQGMGIFPLQSLKTFEYIYYPGYELKSDC